MVRNQSTRRDHVARPRQRRADLDILRSLAMLCIVGLHHMDDYAGQVLSKVSSPVVWPALLAFAFAAGYLFAGSCESMPARKVLARRWIRLYPPFVLALLAQYFVGSVSFDQIGPGLLLLTPVLGINILSLWFVPVILYCHAIGCVLAPVKRRWQRSLLALGMVVALFALGSWLPWLDRRLARLLLGYYVGLESALSPDLDAKIGSPVAGAAFVGAALIFELSTQVASGSQVYVLMGLAKSLSHFMVVLALVRWLTARVSWLRLTRLSKLSYFAYLAHRSVFAVAMLLYYSFWEFEAVRILVFLLAILVVILMPLSFVAQRWYDAVLVWHRARAALAQDA